MICLACGRALRNQQSKELGYGPVCYRRIFGYSAKKRGKKNRLCRSMDDIPDYDIPGQITLYDYLQEQ